MTRVARTSNVQFILISQINMKNLIPPGIFVAERFIKQYIVYPVYLLLVLPLAKRYTANPCFEKRAINI